MLCVIYQWPCGGLIQLFTPLADPGHWRCPQILIKAEHNQFMFHAALPGQIAPANLLLNIGVNPLAQLHHFLTWGTTITRVVKYSRHNWTPLTKSVHNLQKQSLLENNMSNVRVLRAKSADDAKSLPRPRKKPVQSRALITLGALQEAFVRVLIERGYEKMTIREVVSVAGVGIGTFYDYVPNLRTLGASTIHQRCLDSASTLRATVNQNVGKTVEFVVTAMLKSLVQAGFSRPKEWTALLLLERQVSSASALRKVHEEFVEIWAQALRQSCTSLPEAKITSLARTAHALSYGWYSHDLLFYIDDPKHSRSIEEIATAIVDLVRMSTAPK